MPHVDLDARRAYQREYQRRWARENRDKRLIYERNWREGNQDLVEEYRTKSRTEHPEKTRARNTVSRHLLAGKIERKPCEECATTIDVHAHHEDYSRPTDVRWLCRTHHMELHRCAS